MKRIKWLGLGVILGIIGPLFIIVGSEHSNQLDCATTGVPNCFFNPNYSPLAIPGIIAGMAMTAIGFTLVIVVVLDNIKKSNSKSLGRESAKQSA